MFNTIRITPSTRYPQTVTEKRAPTDESVRLLSEMEAAAEKRVIERGNTRCPNTNLEIRWTVMHRPYDLDAMEAHLFFSINGRERHLKVDVCPSRFGDPKEKFLLIHEAVVKDVAETICIELLKNNSMCKTLIGQ